MKLAKRYSQAVRSSNLRDDELHHQCEVLTAMALASIEHKLGPVLFRVKYCNDATSYYSLAEQYGRIVHIRSVRDSWPQHIQPAKITALSLAYWLSDVCPICTGRGHPIILNTPSLAENECLGCKGTGKRPLECDERERKYLENAIDQLDMMILRAGDEAIRKLANDIDF